MRTIFFKVFMVCALLVSANGAAYAGVPTVNVTLNGDIGDEDYFSTSSPSPAPGSAGVDLACRLRVTVS